ncbi:fluoride efflux transporter CrcB [Bacillus sp. SG-1]|uniref:fluoride efflux transporter CrcB n=1 Tax=Bacillus sp. SG-1 TaxID=161544 RepID=UPI0001543C89|nr:fluoride efflux transporter CrcB [Bacillus sp. SG-1]EDL66179.1 camphor resistance protein CrcB [Bacillus sp. SG-1]
MIYLFVGLGGAAGSILRYLTGNLLLGLNPAAFPYGTLAANLAGSFLLGLLTDTWWKNKKIPSEISAAVGTGMIGSFTTFSAFSVETLGLLKEDHYYLAFLYFFLSTAGGLFLAWTGLHVLKGKGVKE